MSSLAALTACLTALNALLLLLFNHYVPEPYMVGQAMALGVQPSSCRPVLTGPAALPRRRTRCSTCARRSATAPAPGGSGTPR